MKKVFILLLGIIFFAGCDKDDQEQQEFNAEQEFNYRIKLIFDYDMTEFYYAYNVAINEIAYITDKNGSKLSNVFNYRREGTYNINPYFDIFMFRDCKNDDFTTNYTYLAVTMRNLDNNKEITIKELITNHDTTICLNLVDFATKLGQIKDY